jgi:RNA-directed DNA polymerase
MAYKSTVIEEIGLTRPNEGLPTAIDDFTLALNLGIRNKTLWWLIRGSQVPAGHSGSMYEEHSVAKRGKSGRAGKRRPIHVPDERLKAVQRSLDRNFVKKIPVGDHVAAYEKGRRTADAARKCAGAGILLTMDLKNFFGSIKLSQVRKMFTTVGYNRQVSSLMAQLCCCTDSRGRRFMPQGTPISPTVANRVADLFFDQEVLRIARSLGWEYIRYSDNIYLTHPQVLPRTEVDRFKESVISIIKKTGWRVHKIRVAPKWRRQEVLGLVVNEHANIRREKYKDLRAILNNCEKYGFESQVKRAGEKVNFKITTTEALISHLRGKLSYVGQVLAPARNECLQASFKRALDKEDTRKTRLWEEEDKYDNS